MTKHILTSALFAGLAAGVLAALLQLTFVAPLLLEGELYESGARVHFSASGSPQSDAGHPPVWEEPQRHIGTLAMNMVTYTGFAFLMIAAFALAGRFGHQVSARSGAIWGLSAFIAVNLAPSFGLAPELPGTIAAELAARQAWWIGCVAATAVALGLFAFGKSTLALAAGVALIVAPHLIGAPQLDVYFGVAAPELAAHFVTRSLGVAAASWVLLGLIAGKLYQQQPA